MTEAAVKAPGRGANRRADRRPPGRRTVQPDTGWFSSPTVRGLLIVALTFIAYIPAMQSGFIWDDDSFLYENKLIHASDGLRRFWFAAEAPDYFPLTSTMLWLEWRLFGMNATGYHVINVLLHIGSSLLLWRILERLRIPAAWAAALLFALHPVNVESVAWITERKNTLSMFFYCAALLSWLRFDQEGRGRWYALALGAFLLALLAKTAVVMLPFVILGMAWWQRGRISRADLLRSVPFFAVAGVLALVTIWFQANRAISTDVVRDDSFLARLAGAGWAVWFYLGKAIVPLNLSFVYPRWTINPASLVAWMPLAGLLAALALFWAKRSAWGRPGLATLGYFALSLFPVLGFFNIYFMSYSLVADHWQYVAVPAVVALMAGGVAYVGQRRGMDQATLRVIGTAAVMVFFALTFTQQRIYASVESLWLDTVSRNPDARLAHNNLATHYEDAGDLQRALHHGQEALRIKPDDATVHYNLGNIQKKLGEKTTAEERFREAIRLKPTFADAHNNLGNLMSEDGRVVEALVAVHEALRLDPGLPEAHFSMGNLLSDRNEAAGSEKHFREAVRLKPDYVEAHNNLANLLLHQGRPEEAAVHFERAIEINPDDLYAHYNYGVLLERLGRRVEAVKQFEAALRIQPGWEPAVKRLEGLK